jgi:hypothetical protein
VITISVKSDIEKVVRRWEGDIKRQVAFAASKAINDTAKDVKQAIDDEIVKVFDRPTPFTQKAVGITYANKRTLTAKVFIKDIQLRYLRLEIEGGTRRPARRALLIPDKVGVNQYGNLPRNKVKQLLARADTFSGQVGGVAGIWQRTGRGLKLLIAYAGQAQYKRRLDFYGIGKRVVAKRIGVNFQAALRYAQATAK